MYKNIGKKIKVLAKIIFIVFTVLSLISDIILLADGADIILILASFIVAPLLAWISSCIMYGFGELIEKTTEIANNTRKNQE